MHRDGPTRLRISRVDRQVFAGESAAASAPELRAYLTDLVAPYGLALRDDLLTGGVGQSYADMAEALIRTCVDAPVDLLVLAHAMPDVLPGQSTATYLSHVCPGKPFAFAVCDQGSAAPFTAVSAARSYVGSTGFRRALVLVVEQSALHHVPATPSAPVPTQHSAVALLLDDAGPGAVTGPRHHTDVADDRAAAVLAQELDACRARAPSADIAVVLGAPLAARMDPADLPPDVTVASAGRPCTGPWWELGGGFGRWMAGGRRVLVADYDPALGYLCTIGVEPVGESLRASG